MPCFLCECQSLTLNRPRIWGKDRGYEPMHNIFLKNWHLWCLLSLESLAGMLWKETIVREVLQSSCSWAPWNLAGLIWSVPTLLLFPGRAWATYYKLFKIQRFLSAKETLSLPNLAVCFWFTALFYHCHSNSELSGTAAISVALVPTFNVHGL